MEIANLQLILVNAAKEELLTRFTRVSRTQKLDGSFISEADFAMQSRVAEELQSKYPQISFLGEEMDASEQLDALNSGNPVWCFDPLDGTSNFTADIPYYSTSLALIEEGKVKLGIVYDPTRDECFTAFEGQGARLNDRQLVSPQRETPLQQSTALVDFKRLPTELSVRLVSELPYASQRSFGSVALDLCWIAAGRCHVYLHGRSNLWDFSAGDLILREAGGMALTLDGETVFTNQLQSRSIIASGDRKLFQHWSAWLRQTG